MNQPAQQGHRYLFAGQSVLAMEPGMTPRVRALIPMGDGTFSIGEPLQGYAAAMRPEPMRYFLGATPA